MNEKVIWIWIYFVLLIIIIIRWSQHEQIRLAEAHQKHQIIAMQCCLTSAKHQQCIVQHQPNISSVLFNSSQTSAVYCSTAAKHQQCIVQQQPNISSAIVASISSVGIVKLKNLFRYFWGYWCLHGFSERRVEVC